MNEERLLEFKFSITEMTLVRLVRLLIHLLPDPPVLEGSVPEKSSLETVPVLTQVALEGLLLRTSVSELDVNLESSLGLWAVVTVLTLPRLPLSGQAGVGLLQVPVEEGAGAHHHLTPGALDTCLLSLHHRDLRLLLGVPVERVFLDVFLVGTDVSAQLTAMFETLVNSLSMSGQLLRLPGPEIAALTLKSRVLRVLVMHPLQVHPVSLPRNVLSIAMFTNELLSPHFALPL